MENIPAYNEKERTYTIPEIPKGMDSTTHHIAHIKEALAIVSEKGSVFIDGTKKDHPFLVEQDHTIQQIAEKYNRRHSGTIDLSKVDEKDKKITAKNPTGVAVAEPAHYIYR